MMRGAIVGHNGVALASFIGAFYAAQMRRSTAPNESYRFACAADALAAVGKLYNTLNAGEYPPVLPPQELSRIAFTMDFPDKLAKRLIPGFGRGRGGQGTPELELGVAPLVEGPRKGRLVPSPDAASRLLGVRLFVFVSEIKSLDAPGPAETDSAFADLLSTPQGSSAARVAVWWLPGAPPKKSFKEEAEKISPIPHPAERPLRSALSARLVPRLLPATQGRATAHSAPIESYFAWVEAEKKRGARRVARRQIFNVGGVEPEYPYEEMTALIDHLGGLST